MTNDSVPTIDLKSLLEVLSALPEDTQISFSGLTYYRGKWRGPKRYNIEFNEHPHRDSKGNLVLEVPEQGN
ncbi:hypothetical protein D3C80_1595010 [compost metagenome]